MTPMNPDSMLMASSLKIEREGTAHKVQVKRPKWMPVACMRKKLIRKFKDIQTEGFTCERAPQALLQQVRFQMMGSNVQVYDLGKYVHSEPFYQIPQSVSNHQKIPSEFGIS